MKKIIGYQDFLKIWESEDSNQKVISKIRRVLIWLSINKGFYAELLSNVIISGSSKIDPPTMCTNGSEIIFHPQFVMNQSEEALRLVLAHEILHCIGDHCNPARMGSRDPGGWNIACDFAINPILAEESGFAFPVDEAGERMGLIDKKYDGWRPEDIYEDLIKEGILSPNGEASTPPALILLSKSAMGEIAPEGTEIADSSDGGLDDITGNRGEGEGEGEGKGEGEGEGQDKGEKGGKATHVKVGDKVRTKDGTIARVKKVNPDLSIEI